MHKCSAQKKAKMEIVSGKSYGTLLGPLCAQIFEGGGGGVGEFYERKFGVR